jgi:hypothetical protein
MSCDIKMVRVTGTGSAKAGRARIQAVSVLISSGGAGRLTITDGNGGATLLDMDFGANASDNITLPGNGILAATGLHVATATNVTAATLFYEG